jgi:anti-sigma-K factor RskA
MDDVKEVRDLLPAWALDAVDDVDRARVERAIREDPGLAQEARALLETTARLAETAAAAPPEGLRAQVLAAVASVPQRSTTAERPRPAAAVAPPARRRSRVPLWIAAAAVATMGMVAPAVLAVQQAGRAEQAELQVAMFADALSRPGAEVVAGEVEGGGEAVAILTEEGAVFAIRGLRAPGEELGYQLWVIEGEDRVSAGVLPLAGGSAYVEIAAVPGNTLAVTLEPAGGSLQPTTEPIVVLPQPDAPPEDGSAEA